MEVEGEAENERRFLFSQGHTYLQTLMGAGMWQEKGLDQVLQEMGQGLYSTGYLNITYLRTRWG